MDTPSPQAPDWAKGKRMYEAEKINQINSTATPFWQGQLQGAAQALKQQQQSLGQTLGLKKDLKTDVEGLVKRAHNIRQQLEQVFEVFFGPVPETCENAACSRTPSIEGDLSEAYDILAGVDSKLNALLVRVGGR